MRMDLADKESVEIEYWKTNPYEAPGMDSVQNMVGKIAFIPNLSEVVEPFDALFRGFGSVLELGAGQGWASAFLNRLYPQARFTPSDISEHAVASVSRWEHVFNVRFEMPLVCKSYEVPVPDASFDAVFACNSAHHFVAHRRTLLELRRILKPGGHAFYFHEPCCRRWIHRLAHWRVNRQRPDVPEDVLVFPHLLRLAREAGLEAEFRFTPTLNQRRPFEFFYYFALKKLPFLQQLVPCTGTFHFRKP